MEKAGMIKCVKGNQPERKKVYLLSAVEPDSKIAGDAWEKKANFFEMINDLQNKVFDYVCHEMCKGKPGVTPQKIISFMAE